MLILRNILILLVMIFFGVIYYTFSVSRNTKFKNFAFIMKIAFLVLSFVLAFANVDFIIIGDLAFGGRVPILTLILIDIVDAFVDKKKK